MTPTEIVGVEMRVGTSGRALIGNEGGHQLELWVGINWKFAKKPIPIIQALARCEHAK